ncbi:MAG: sulfotransferase family 2 domain-containing protein [Sulfitobacter sp.]
MAARFDYFVIFAEMRTGSNFLETNLNALEGVSCLGEVFNPHFVGYPNAKDVLGVTQEDRDADPLVLIEKIKSDPSGLSGFRYFHDHDARVLETCLDDPKCAKIILTRNPVESYISWKIAKATGQWKLTNVTRRKDAAAYFDALEFQDHLGKTQDFQVVLLNHLQVTGQTAFYIGYEDLQSVDVLNGLARFLGVDGRLDTLDKQLKKQSLKSLSSKVANFAEMEQSLAKMDRYNLTRTPNFEPRRGPAIPTYVTAVQAPLVFFPITGGPSELVENWLASLDNAADEDLAKGLSQKELRQWKRKHGAHRSFTVLRHPVARAHHVFCTKILNAEPDGYPALRKTLIKRHGVKIPADGPDQDYDAATHRAAFHAFLVFLKANLAGQTAVRVDAAWATQSQTLQGFGEFALPDRVIREDDLNVELAALANSVGRHGAPDVAQAAPDAPFALDDIYDGETEKLVKDVYQRDYMMFGFPKWR